MTWSTQFRRTLNDPSVTIRYELRAYILPSDSLANTNGVVRDTGRIAISDEYIEIQGVSVVPQSWQITFGGFTISLTGDLRPLSTGPFQKGTIAALFMSRNGMPAERVCVGQLVSITGVRNQWTFEFVDILTMLYARLTVSENQQSFYYNAGKVSTVNSNFSWPSDTRLYVNTIALFAKDSSTDGLVKIDHGGAIDYWSYSAATEFPPSSGNGYLTITGINQYPSTGSVSAMSIGENVTVLARLKGRPDYILHRTMVSLKGDHTEGVFDDYPSSYGINVRWGTPIFDSNDSSWWYNNVLKPSTTDLSLDLLYSEPATGGIRALIDKLSVIGIWPVWRQDQMSIRHTV